MDEAYRELGEAARRAGEEMVRAGDELRRDRRRGKWLSRRCRDCNGHKPLFTAYCDPCAEMHGL